jgi:hypothetical protein
MPLPTIPLTARVALRGHTSEGHKFVNVLHFRRNDVLTDTGARAVIGPALVTLIQTAVTGGNSWTASVPASAGWDDWTYTPLDSAGATVVTALGIAGGSAVVQLPAEVALVVTLRTAIRGRSYRGRVYTGPWTSDQNTTNGRPLQASVNNMAARWERLRTSLVGSGVALVVASYLHSTAADVIGCTADNRWDSQRRRMGR